MKKINDVLRAFASLETEGFRRKGKRWTRRSSETIVVVDLQKSSWGNSYFLNFAVWLLGAGDPPESIREEMCDLRVRLGEGLEYALSLEYEMDPEERRDTLKTLIHQTVVPLAEQCKTASGCAAEVSAGRFDWVSRRAENILGVRRGLSDASRRRLEAEIADESTAPEEAARLRSILESYPPKNPDKCK